MFFQYGHAQLSDNYDISTSSNGVIDMPSGLPNSYSSFVKYTKIQAPNGQAIHFIAQNAISEAQIVRARNILQFYLTNYEGSTYGSDKSSVINQMGTNEATLMLLNGSDGDSNPPNVNGQPLYENEMAVEGHQWYINNDYNEHRDASFEEILHMMHDTGIGVDGNNSQPGALPAYQAEIRAAQDHADNNNFAIWPIGSSATSGWYLELAQENSLSQEYLASVVDSYYGLWGAWTESATNGMWGLYIAKTRAEIETEDPMGYALMPKYFSPFININMDIDPSFNGSFSMDFNSAEPYTHKSQYLQHCTLTGNNPSNLKGNNQYNRLIGNNADNQLEGGKGNDRLNGMGGTNIAIYKGNQGDYSINHLGIATIISDNIADRDGIDTLVNIQTIRYADGDISTPTSVSNITSIEVFKIYPNPSSEYITLQWITTSPIQSGIIKLYNHLGHSIKTIEFKEDLNEVKIDVHSYPPGQYTVQLICEGKSSSSNLVIY